MGEVLQFRETPKTEDGETLTLTAMVCGCGGFEFLLLEDGSVVCSGCENLIQPLFWGDDREEVG